MDLEKLFEAIEDDHDKFDPNILSQRFTNLDDAC